MEAVNKLKEVTFERIIMDIQLHITDMIEIRFSNENERARYYKMIIEKRYHGNDLSIYVSTPRHIVLYRGKYIENYNVKCEYYQIDDNSFVEWKDFYAINR